MNPVQKIPQLSNQTDKSPQQIQDELTHVNHEMYKKNLELAEKNKILSLLRQVDSVILSSIIDIKQTVQKTANIIVEEADFIKALTILTFDKETNSIIPIAISKTNMVQKLELELKKNLADIKIDINNQKNTIALAVKQKKMLLTHDLFDVLTPFFTQEDAKMIQSTLEVDISYVYPFLVHGEVIGAMVISVRDPDKSLPYYKIDLIDRLPGIIAIAMDNAMLYQNMEKANQHLRELDKLKNEFVSIASHELRTPLTVIRSYVWMVAKGNIGILNEKQKIYLDRTLSSAERLIALVNDMLNVSRIESGKLKLEPIQSDLGELISSVINEMQPRASEIGVSLSYVPPLSPIILNLDVGKIKEVIINLIGNSLKFTPKEGFITVALEKTDQGSAVVKVKDTGKGIIPENIPKLFQKFYMVSEKSLTKDLGQGTGLGLYLSKALVELHGGKIWAQSQGEGKGATFSFSIPLVNNLLEQKPIPSVEVAPAAQEQADTQLSP